MQMIKQRRFYETVERKSFKTPDRNFSYQTIWHWSDYSSLLHLTKDQLPVTFHFEDRSNTSLAYLRNRIRLSYLPTLSQENPKFKEHLCLLAEEIGLMKQALGELTKDITITDLSVFQQQSDPVQLFLLQNYLDTFPDLQLSKGQFNQLISYLRKNGSGKIPLKMVMN